VSQWIYKGMEVNKGVWLFVNHTPSVQCARMFIYIIACMLSYDTLEHPNHKDINIGFFKNCQELIALLASMCFIIVGMQPLRQSTPISCILMSIDLNIVLYKRRA